MTTTPGYWVHETSGLVPAVKAYLNNEALTEEQITLIRAYMRQWINASVWDQNPHAGPGAHAWLAAMRSAVDGLISRPAIARWIDRAAAKGLDPI